MTWRLLQSEFCGFSAKITVTVYTRLYDIWLDLPQTLHGNLTNVRYSMYIRGLAHKNSKLCKGITWVYGNLRVYLDFPASNGWRCKREFWQTVWFFSCKVRKFFLTLYFLVIPLVDLLGPLKIFAIEPIVAKFIQKKWTFLSFSCYVNQL